MIWIKNTFLLLTLVFLTACGYHLRGNIDLPEGMKNIYLEGGSGQLRQGLKKTLRFSSGTLVTRVEDAGIIVKVVRENMRRRVISLSSTGRANEYELYYELDFILLDAEGEKLSEIQSVEITREYFIDQDEILGKSDEDQTIRSEMYRQAVQTIVDRSRVVLEKIIK